MKKVGEIFLSMDFYFYSHSILTRISTVYEKVFIRLLVHNQFTPNLSTIKTEEKPMDRRVGVIKGLKTIFFIVTLKIFYLALRTSPAGRTERR